MMTKKLQARLYGIDSHMVVNHPGLDAWQVEDYKVVNTQLQGEEGQCQ